MFHTIVIPLAFCKHCAIFNGNAPDMFGQRKSRTRCRGVGMSYGPEIEPFLFKFKFDCAIKICLNSVHSNCRHPLTDQSQSLSQNVPRIRPSLSAVCL